LESQLESLVAREKAVQDALVSAQKLRDDLKTQTEQDAEILKGQAAREAELLRAEADAEIQRRLGEAEGLIRERKRALEELERSRLKFLKSYRGLLEREMDSIEVEESREPLEEVPLDLEFRGWVPSREKEAERIPGGFDTQVLTSSTPVGIESLAPDKVESDFASTEARPDAAVSGADRESASSEAEPGLGRRESGPSGVGSQESTEGNPTDSPQAANAGEREETDSLEEPKWLFSLLKKEETKRAEE
jgi:hypothetical protein